jgi:hypothetical protein
LNSLFTEEGKTAIAERLGKLRPDSQRQWGKMNPAQMLHHCQKPLEVAIDGADVKVSLIGRLVGGMIKKKMLQPGAPFRKNSPTAPSFKIADERNFEKERTQLLAEIERFNRAGAQGKLLGRHPFFGNMTANDWDIMSWKHLDHHLRQFGV